MEQKWWKEAVIYQIYPRSFKDANNDGVGDLKGISSKLSYLKDLGIDVIWLSPHYESPNVDNGYDISDYQNIMAEFGTMYDFDEMLDEIHRLGMKLIIDLVVNHSSDQHHWFKQARKSNDNPYRDYYIWKKEVPNDWISFFSGTAWEYDEATQEYYLHLFAKEQPDLNWENEKLRKEIYQMMQFWLDKGVDGFRMDVISMISKDQTFSNYPEHRRGDLSLYANGPRVHEFLQEMHKEVLSKYDCMTVGEAFGVSSTQALDYVGNNRNELNIIYHFDHAVPRDEHFFAKPAPEFSLTQLKSIFNKWDAALKNDGWNTVYFGNHDNPRMISRFGDPQNYHYQSSTMLATILLTLRGTPFLYQGDEIGMTNSNFKAIEQFNDLQVVNAYNTLVVNGNCSNVDFINAANYIARDHARTPMQWSAGHNAGFSDGDKTWLKVNDNYKTINVASQEDIEGSILSYYKKIIKLRKNDLVLQYGDYEDLAPYNSAVWAYTRSLEQTKKLIICNFTDKIQTIDLSFGNLKLLVSNYDLSSDVVSTLQPYESKIFEFL
jgi:oligo-1,6-glucosidase